MTDAVIVPAGTFVMEGTSDADTVRDLLEEAADLIQGCMNSVSFDVVVDGKHPDPADLAELAIMRQAVNRFTETARHLVQSRYLPRQPRQPGSH